MSIIPHTKKTKKNPTHVFNLYLFSVFWVSFLILCIMKQAPKNKPERQDSIYWYWKHYPTLFASTFHFLKAFSFTVTSPLGKSVTSSCRTGRHTKTRMSKFGLYKTQHESEKPQFHMSPYYGVRKPDFIFLVERHPAPKLREKGIQ